MLKKWAVTIVLYMYGTASGRSVGVWSDVQTRYHQSLSASLTALNSAIMALSMWQAPVMILLICGNSSLKALQLLQIQTNGC